MAEATALTLDPIDKYDDLAFQHPSIYHKGLDPDKKIELVVAFLTTGSLKGAAQITGLTIREVHESRQTEWWEHLHGAIVAEHGTKLRARCNALIDAGLINLSKRMEQGDQKIGKDGEIQNLAVSARDSAYVVDMMMTQCDALDKKTRQMGSADAEARILSKIADGLADIAREVKAKDVTPLPHELPIVEGETVLVESSP